MHTLPVDPASAGLARFEQYDLGTGIWIPASDGDIFRRPPPSPHTLIHHIFTCCHSKYWNKGIMYCAETEHAWLVKQDLRFAWIERELVRLERGINRAHDKGLHTEMEELLHRKKLLSTPAERQRRLEEVPEIVPDTEYEEKETGLEVAESNSS